MKRILLIPFLLVFLLFFACADERKVNDALLAAENLLLQQSDSALQMLDSLSPESMNNYNKAYYYLLLTEARDKNKQSLLHSDSLLDWTLGYLNPETDRLLTIKTLRYKGKVWAELQEPDIAVAWFQKALDLIDEKKDYEILSDIYTDIGNLYLDQALYRQARIMFNKAYTLDTQWENNSKSAYDLIHLGNTYLMENEQDSVHFYLRKSYIFASQAEDSLKLYDIINNNLSIFFQEKEDYKEALIRLQKITQLNNSSLDMNKGIIFYKLQQYDSARYYIQNGIEQGDIYTQTTGYWYLSELENQLGEHKKALGYLMDYSELRDSLEHITRTAEMNIMGHKYNVQAAIDKVDAEHRLKVWLIILSSLFILIFVSSAFFFQSKRRREAQEKEILQKEKEILELNTQMTQIKSSIVDLQQNTEKVGKLHSEIQEKEKELRAYNVQIDELQCRLFQIKPIYKKIQQLKAQKLDRLSMKSQIELKNEISASFSIYIAKLEDLCPQLTEEDLIFCCLFKLKLDMPTVSLCYGVTDTNAVRQRKSRIKKKMTEDSQCEDLYASIFES
ncbi:MAG: hypothetical protein LBN18_08230 [Dysgonamonadaceae bacterium]|jgi:tetratricopeptide (TPR) repeat protein|nr:hypothetical protein [Dysgonamonadaceae bacterium]